MDLVQGLSAASTGLAIVKQPRDIDHSVDEAAFKRATADSTESRANTRIALSDAKMAINKRDLHISDLKTKLEAFAKGAACPRCSMGNLVVTATKPATIRLSAKHGVQEWTMGCNNCEHSETKIHDPNNILNRR